MSDRRNILDQCPSTIKRGSDAASAAPAATPHAPSAPDVSVQALAASAGTTGKSYWRSLDELAGRAEFKEFLQREFPAYASELLDGTRRNFLRIMGASLALAGAATLPGCRRPDHKILTYNKQPEEVVPGKALYYATAMPRPGGGCEGLLAETYEGRPTKLEGNPLHSESMGKSTLLAQASVLDLYDPDRDPAVIAAMAEARGETFNVTDWAAFTTFAQTHFPAFDASKGAGLAFLVEKATSPSRDRLRDEVQRRWPEAQWLVHEAVDAEGHLEGTRAAFGTPMKEFVDFASAKVVVSFDRELGAGASELGESRGFGQSRYRDGADPAHPASGSTMSRLYAFESMVSLLGAQADHRFAVKPSQIAACLGQLARLVMTKMGVAGPLDATIDALAASSTSGLPSTEVLQAIADDLLANRGASAVLVGPGQPAIVHALACGLNLMLGNVSQVIRYVPVTGDAAQNSNDSIRTLASAIDAGSVDTLVVIGCNPVYTAPGDLDFKAKYAKVRHTIHLGAPDETGQASTTHLSRCHFLESWSDVQTWDGLYSVVQPMIEPLFPSHNELELLAAILGKPDTDPYTIVRATVQARAGSAIFEKLWRATLHDGRSGAAAPAGRAPQINPPGLAQALARWQPPQAQGLEAMFVASPHVHDGRFANNGWLQELPNTMTKVSWDNPALVSPATAVKLGLTTNRHPVTPEYNHGIMAAVTIGMRTLNIPVWIQPGLADDVVVLQLGYGRRVGGRIAEGTGFNTYTLRRSDALHSVSGVTVQKAINESPYLLACTQDHWTLEGRDIFREIDLPRWQKFGDLDYLSKDELQYDSYDRSRRLNFAGLMGMESHTPANVDIYKKSQKQAQGLRFTEEDAKGDPLRDEKGNIVPIKNIHGKRIQQWGMSIDLTTCTGCAACVVACQAENNIPIVGKMEVAKGREMHWIRVDRYYSTAAPGVDEKNTMGIGGDADIVSQPEVSVMPITCVHCESAPCEVVCPVNATVHDEQGNNNMAYNRCIGTRYCSNNCPYKVRRFNFFDYATKQFRGNFAGKEETEALPKIMRPPSENFVPPRLREKKIEVATMQSNPHVTVRSRGVMEKCTYCIQRVNAARVETKLADLSHIPDGFMQTACQQACPTNAIVFGDIYDHDANEGRGSLVKQKRNHGRSYQLLAFLNTRPRTTHMLRLRNPNPVLSDAARKASWEQPLGHHGHGSHDSHGAPGHTDDHSGEGHAHDKPAGHVMSLPLLNGGALLS